MDMSKLRTGSALILMCGIKNSEGKTHILCSSSDDMEPVISRFDIHPLKDKDGGK